MCLLLFYIESRTFRTELDGTWALCCLAADEWNIHIWASQNPGISGAQKCPIFGSEKGLSSPFCINVVLFDSFEISTFPKIKKSQYIHTILIFYIHKFGMHGTWFCCIVMDRDELPFGEWFKSTSFVCCINKVNMKSAAPSVPLFTSISSSPKMYNKKVYKMDLFWKYII